MLQVIFTVEPLYLRQPNGQISVHCYGNYLFKLMQIFQLLAIDTPVFSSNHVSNSHRLEDIGDFLIRDLDMTTMMVIQVLATKFGDLKQVILLTAVQ